MRIIIAGAGPVGLMLAAELRLFGVTVTVVEKLAESTGFSKAGGLHPRTVESAELRGMVEGLRARAERKSSRLRSYQARARGAFRWRISPASGRSGWTGCPPTRPASSGSSRPTWRISSPSGPSGSARPSYVDTRSSVSTRTRTK
ncbi:FAD-dependent monooxygenase [Fodinicola feengrottensis]|uniref:FAD-dependent monooxygenase n=1 Tax=Fodinicola feengrottensis TaxID=435914 RepID=UPI002442D51C|nr:FAD-dependent monooxygenase [Fodinicola feengrottensis]